MRLRRKVGEKGQVVIPKDIRDEEGINSDTEVYFRKENGKIVIEKKEIKLSETLKNVSEEVEEFDSEDEDQVERRMRRAGIEI